MTTEKERIFELIERTDGPALIAYWLDQEVASEYGQDTLTHDWHRHARGQFFCVESGLIHVHTEHGSWLLPPHRAGWMPPGAWHTVTISGPISGWGVFITGGVDHGMPAEPCVIGVGELTRALVRRASSWTWHERLNQEQERLMAVLLDEIRRAPHEPLHLPMPQDRRLLRIAQAVLEQPQDGRGLHEWAAWGGLSARSLSRLFRSETALSFAQWRQQARLGRGLECLAEGMPVAEVADALGYVSVSAFVAMFRRNFGQPPARYFAQRQTPISDADALEPRRVLFS